MAKTKIKNKIRGAAKGVRGVADTTAEIAMGIGRAAQAVARVGMGKTQGRRKTRTSRSRSRR